MHSNRMKVTMIVDPQGRRVLHLGKYLGSTEAERSHTSSGAKNISNALVPGGHFGPLVPRGGLSCAL